jgi:hypothetical protein
MFKKILLEIHAAVAVGWVEAHKFITVSPKVKFTETQEIIHYSG